MFLFSDGGASLHELENVAAAIAEENQLAAQKPQYPSSASSMVELELLSFSP